jgi:molecular chaperone DnaJ
MATQKADYYETLGVGRNAGADEVKRAFRRLAMEFHPDRNADPEAEARFKDINEAYEVLSDAEKRAAYDRYGHAGLDGSFTNRGFEGFGPFGGFGDIFDAFFGASQGRRRQARRGADLQMELQLTFEEAAFGTTKTVDVTRTELCTVCDGLRSEPGTEPRKCEACGGSGEVRRVQNSVFGQFVNLTACDRCRGEGWLITNPCKHCRGSGRERVSRSLELKIPAGVEDGNQMRLSSEGELGQNGGPRGNAYFIIAVKPHELFVRDGDDLVFDLNLNFAQAALGDEIEIPTLEGGSHTLKIAPGTQSGDVISVRGKGIARLRGSGRGDLLAHVQVVTPKNLSSDQKRLLRELGETMHGGAGKNLFDKVKDALG